MKMKSIEREKRIKGQKNVRTDSEMIEAAFKALLNNMMTSTKAIRKAARKIANKTLCSSPNPSVTLYTWLDNHFREHIINLIDKSKQAF